MVSCFCQALYIQLITAVGCSSAVTRPVRTLGASMPVMCQNSPYSVDVVRYCMHITRTFLCLSSHTHILHSGNPSAFRPLYWCVSEAVVGLEDHRVDVHPQLSLAAIGTPAYLHAIGSTTSAFHQYSIVTQICRHLRNSCPPFNKPCLLHRLLTPASRAPKSTWPPDLEAYSSMAFDEVII